MRLSVCIRIRCKITSVKIFLPKYSRAVIFSQNKCVITLFFSKSSSPVAMVSKVTCQICLFPDNNPGQIGMSQVYDN